MDAKLELLLDLSQLQTKVGDLFFQAEATKACGDYGPAHSAYQKYITSSRAFLQATLDFNIQVPDSPFEISSIAQPLVNALMVDADIVQSMGDRKSAEAFRKEALEISRIHMGRKGMADTSRARASALTMEGRFNEAIVALMSAHDVLLEENDPIEMARVTIDP